MLSFILGLAVFISCRNNRMPAQIDPELPCPTPEQVSFSKDVLPVLVNNCATQGCHSGKTPEAGFNLDAAVAYATLSKKGSGYIDTLAPRYSALYSSMASESNPMPPTGKLDRCKLELIEKWMAQEAKNN